MFQLRAVADGLCRSLEDQVESVKNVLTRCEDAVLVLGEILRLAFVRSRTEVHGPVEPDTE